MPKPIIKKETHEIHEHPSLPEKHPIEQSKWNGHKITRGSLLKIPIFLLKAPLFFVGGLFTAMMSPLILIGAFVVAKNDRAYGFVVDKILLDSRDSKPDIPNPKFPFDQAGFQIDQEISLSDRVVQGSLDALLREDQLNINAEGFSFGFYAVDPARLNKNFLFTDEEIASIREHISAELKENGVPSDGKSHEAFEQFVDSIVRHITTRTPQDKEELLSITPSNISSEIQNKRKKAIKETLPNELLKCINADRASLVSNTKISTPDGIELDGYTITHPDQRNTPPENQTWIVYHLSKGNTYETQMPMLYRMSKETGSNVLVYNYRGVKDSQDSAKDVPLTEALLVTDAEAVVTHLTQSGVQCKNMMMMGHSQGGAIAAQVAAKHQTPDDYMHLAVMHTYRSYSEVVKELIPLPLVGRIFARAIRKRWKFNTKAVLPEIKGRVITVENPQDRVVKTRLRADTSIGLHLQMSTQPLPKAKNPILASLLFGKHGQAAHNITVYSYNSQDDTTREKFTEAISTTFPIAAPPKEPHPDDLPLPPPKEPHPDDLPLPPPKEPHPDDILKEKLEPPVKAHKPPAPKRKPPPRPS